MPPAKKVPKILVERRSPKDDITQRDWTWNKLGEAFTKKPEQMTLAKFYAKSHEGGSPGTYRQHKLLQQKIRALIQARPIREHGMQIFKGDSGAYYLKMKGIHSERAVWIRIENRKIRKAVEFLWQ